MSTASRSRQPGHPFLAYGRMETIVHDAAVVPTDLRFSVRRSWGPLLGRPVERAKPRDWPATYSRSAVHDNIWFFHVGDIAHRGTPSLTARAVELLGAIADSGLPIGRGRTKLRVAKPVLAIAGGGVAARQGEGCSRR